MTHRLLVSGPAGAARIASALFLGGCFLWPALLPGAQEPVVRYHVRGSLDDTAGVISGTVEIHYRHPGPDPLRALTLSLPYNGLRFRDPRESVRTIQIGGPGSQRVSALRIDGSDGAMEWPAAGDSSLAVVSLPRALGAGDSVRLSMDWTARPPEAGPRIDRRGRRMNLMGWYPRLLDPTSRASVPFPAFSTVLAELDLASDQVIAGTGVPLCGDPGWLRARAFPTTRVTYQRDSYEASDGRVPMPDCGGSAPGRKKLAWYAERVTELALVLSPSFRYEEGDYDHRPVRALYEADEERSWGAGLTTGRAETALAWIEELGARNPWPHLTIAPALGPGGRALPMVLLPETSTQAALLELLGLMFTEQVMTGGNPVFTVGAAAFQTAWFFETLGRRGDYARLEREILDWDLDRLGLTDEPVPRASLTSPCGTTSCRRTEFLLYQLRNWSGDPNAIRRIYQELYRRFTLRPTEQGAFQNAARAVIQPSPDPLYIQLAIRPGALYDDAIRSARRERVDGAGWRTTVIIERNAPGIYPRTVEVVAEAEEDTREVRGTALTPAETLTVVTRTRPLEVALDPRRESHDWNMLNNRKKFGFRPGWLLLTPQRPRELYIDTYLARRSARDRVTVGLAPTIWYNDEGGWTFGWRLREDYLGRFELNELWGAFTTGWGTPELSNRVQGRLRLRNPVWLRGAGWSQEVVVALEEGRALGRVAVTRQFRSRVTDRTWRSIGIALQWLEVTEPDYTDPGYYDDAGTGEVTLTGRFARPSGPFPLELRADLAGGWAWPKRGSAVQRAAYGRVTVAASGRSSAERTVSVGGRLYAGAVFGADPIPRQRRIPLGGADPYQRFDSPFLRSRGSLLSGRRYHVPGGAGVRGLDPRLSGSHVLGAGTELELAVRKRPAPGLLGRVAVAAFADLAFADGDLDLGGGRLRSVGDAGLGLRVTHRLGDTRFMTRLDFPLWVSRPALAADTGPDRRFGFRWAVSFDPSW